MKRLWSSLHEGARIDESAIYVATSAHISTGKAAIAPHRTPK